MSYSEYTLAVTFADDARETYIIWSESLTDAMFNLLLTLLDEEAEWHKDLKQHGDVVKMKYVPPDIEKLLRILRTARNIQDDANRILAEETTTKPC